MKISGAPANAPPNRLPLLVVQGTHDSMMPAALAQQYAADSRAPYTYHSLEGGHFIFLSKWQEVTSAVGAWLTQQMRDRI